MKRKCGQKECRYNMSGQCKSDSEYNKCLTRVKSILGENYEEFVKWEEMEELFHD